MLNSIKIFLTTLVVLSTCNFSRAQSLDAIDKKQGYFNLNIGDPYQKWDSQMDFFLDNGTQKSYFFKSSKELIAYDYQIRKVIATFSNQKLISTTLDFEVWDVPAEGKFTDLGVSLDKLAKLVTSIKSEYGNPTNSNTDETNGKIAVYWEAKQNYLLLKLTYLGVRKGSRVTLDFGNKIQMANSLKN